MVVFVSWSAPISHKIAQALCEWLPELNPSWETYISDEIEAGSFWFEELTDSLKKAHAAILCMTRENLQSPWLLFEAGALCIGSDVPVIPVLFRLESSDLEKNPLHYFQSVDFSKSGIWNLTRKLNRICGDELSTEDMRKKFENTYPKLKEKISAINVPPEWDQMEYVTGKYYLSPATQ